MKTSDQNSNTSLSPSPKRGGWRRLFLWGLLGGGLLFFLLTVFLISITLPNLREATPPEISGPHQMAQSQKPSNHSTSPTSATQSISTSTSETQSLLNLDDFPHLSPKMRELTQAWLEQHEKIRQAIEAQITDPVLRAQMLAKLKDRQEKVWALLNLPLEWENQTYEEAWRRRVEDNPSYIFDIGGNTNEEKSRFRDEYPELRRMLSSERICVLGISSRTWFELSIHYQDWGSAVDDGNNYARPPDFDPLFQSQGKTYHTWEEESYCWRQLGGPGLVGLTARSYQRTLDTQMQDHYSPLYQNLRGLGAAAVDRVAWKTKKMKNEEDLKSRLKRFWFED